MILQHSVFRSKLKEKEKEKKSRELFLLVRRNNFLLFHHVQPNLHTRNRFLPCGIRRRKDPIVGTLIIMGGKAFSFFLAANQPTTFHPAILILRVTEQK
ncbi:CLUMA_CG006138, isoform A [Clunio marinus]|uniref:CLUMA_CG006138, isoform A n=1 Tax=Clunio marinus TaxID=568069 RepID=A0A1J1HX31_9DIPT|nr:CLUMA_CG006138, isoform A [Clunio marinus]